jgi:alginate O-acetyltransferase complex protein AlgI
MLFNSVVFLFYFLPAFLILYFITPARFRNYVILAGSIVFYSWGGPAFLFVILLTTALDFILVRQIEKSPLGKRKKAFLCISLCVNLGLLFFFKYLQFFITNLNDIGHLFGFKPIAYSHLALPIGISFFTFESLTYVIDVYRGEYRSLKSFRNYLTYILMFPKLIAGPIVPYNKIGWQIEGARTASAEMRLSGLLRFIFGLSKKVLIANVLGETVSYMNRYHMDLIDTPMAWTLTTAYTMQLYFDFSGYSDMAIGLSRIMGFSIPENFNFPYISRSLTEFWRRWHMSLGNWMRNYLYIPLGGSLHGSGRTYLNLWIVFLISGFWHGAGWNFILWGAYHGFFLFIERLFLGRFLTKGIAVIYTFLIANIGWVMFQNEDFNDMKCIYTQMFSWRLLAPSLFLDTRFYVVLGLALFLAFSGMIRPIYRFGQNDAQFFTGNSIRLAALYMLALGLLLLSASYLVGQHFNPFIYFRF